MKILAKVIHGSRLYGLDGPSSDTDTKSIHLPDLKSCVLLRATKTIQEKSGEIEGEIDKSNIEEGESFALQRFLSLAANGDDVAVTMLHCPDVKIIIDSLTYQFIRANRAKFYTKGMSNSLGFASSMALKYGYRADRMADAEKALNFLKEADQKGIGRLWQVWKDLPLSQYLTKQVDERNNDVYQVANKKLQSTIAVNYAIEIIQHLVNSFGERVNAAKNMGGGDFKAISHSFRVAYQLKHIFIDGDFSFPLPESNFIKDVKFGKLSYVDDKLDEKLNELIVEIENLSKQSSFPEKINQKWLDEIVLKEYGLL